MGYLLEDVHLHLQFLQQVGYLLEDAHLHLQFLPQVEAVYGMLWDT